ncbi:MAG: zinc metallopeptidase, partial [Anaerolineae bacterium]|nr:zinc metallopeptidase [Anaerolineae bacterium]
MFFDSQYLLLVMLPSLILSGLAQFFVRSTYSKWSNVQNQRKLAGSQVGLAIIQSSGLQGVRLEGTPGELTDHFDPATNVVRMSESVASRPSVAAMAIVAHELGHAQQYQEKSILIAARGFLLPAVRISPTISYGLILGGLFMNAAGLIQLGIIFFGITVLFMLLTLPVEIDASMRGMRLLRASGIASSEE